MFLTYFIFSFSTPKLPPTYFEQDSYYSYAIIHLRLCVCVCLIFFWSKEVFIKLCPTVLQYSWNKGCEPLTNEIKMLDP